MIQSVRAPQNNFVIITSMQIYSLLCAYYIGNVRLLLQHAVAQAGQTDAPSGSNVMCGAPVTQYQALLNDWIDFVCDPPVLARYVIVHVPQQETGLILCEVMVTRCDPPPGGKNMHGNSQ